MPKFIRVRKPLIALLLCALPFTPSAVLHAQPNAATVAAPSASPDMSAALGRIEEALEARRKELNIPGMSLAIVKDDQVIYTKGFGVKDFERGVPVTPDTLFAIGSSTKAFTAVGVLMAQDEGKMSLDDSPKKYLPYFRLQDPEADSKIVIRDLLSHRSGLNRTDLAWLTGRLSREEIIRVAGLAKPTAKFREKFQYQNTMYVVAGEALARAQGKTWDAVVRSRIFKPLGMTRTVTTFPEMTKSGDYSFGYEYDPAAKVARRVPFRELPTVAPAGAINSSARDMAQWIRFMLSGGVSGGKRLVSEAGMAELTKPHIEIAPKVGYGLGWYLREWKGKRVVEHGGNIDGFSALVALMPEERLGFVLLTNVRSSPIRQNSMEVIWSNLAGEGSAEAPAAPNAKFAGGKPSDPEAATSDPAAAETLRRTVGRYQAKDGKREVEIVERDGKISLIVPGQRPYPLSPREPDVFRAAGLPDSYSLKVDRDAAGNITGITLRQPQGNFPLTRAAEFKAPLTVEELMNKVVEAMGGEQALRRHTSLQQIVRLDFENQGVTATGTISQRVPNLYREEFKLFALGKEIASRTEVFDGTRGLETTSYAPPEEPRGAALANKRTNADFHQPLNWRTLFKKIEITGTKKVGDEECYVVRKTPAEGHAVTDYVSATTFRILRRDSLAASSTSDDTQPVTETFGDFRSIEGVLMPFKIVTTRASGGTIVTTVTEARANVPLADSLFRVPTTGAAAATAK